MGINPTKFEVFCDWTMVTGLCAAVFVLPASIGLLNSFAGLAIFAYLLKKLSRLIIDWPLKASHLNFPAKLGFIWRGFAPPENCINRPLQFVALAFFISAVLSHYCFHLSLPAFFGKFIKCVFLYFAFIEAFSDEKRIRIFLTCFLASALITSFSGIYQHFTAKDFIKGRMMGYENNMLTGRISSVFYSANGLGAYLLLPLALVTHLLFASINHRKSWALTGGFSLSLLILMITLCWTYSRSAWIGYIVILGLIVLLDHRKIIYTMALILIFIFMFLPSLTHVRHLNLINDGQRINNVSVDPVELMLEEGGSGRLAYWEKAISIIRLSPVFGTGLNTYARVLKERLHSKQIWYAHNCYLQMTAETGFLGVACFLWMLFTLLFHGFKDCAQIKSFWPLTLLQGTISGLCAFLIQSSLDNTFYTVQLGMLMWMCFGLMVALARLKPALGDPR